MRYVEGMRYFRQFMTMLQTEKCQPTHRQIQNMILNYKQKCAFEADFRDNKAKSGGKVRCVTGRDCIICKCLMLRTDAMLRIWLCWWRIAAWAEKSTVMVVMGSAIEKRGSFNTAVSLANDYKRLYCKRLYGEGKHAIKKWNETSSRVWGEFSRKVTYFYGVKNKIVAKEKK